MIEILSLWVDIQRVHIRADNVLKRQVLAFINEFIEEKYKNSMLEITSKLNVSSYNVYNVTV